MDLYHGPNTTQGRRESSKRSMVTLLGLSAYNSRKDGEREPLSRSRFERWSGAMEESCDPLTPDERNEESISGGIGSTLRSSKASFLRAAKARLFKRQSESYFLGSRERAATSVRSPDDTMATLERRSSLGYERLPEMPKGQVLQDGDMECDPEDRHWKARSEQHSVKPETSGGDYKGGSAGHMDRGYSRRRGSRIKKEDSLLRAVTFLEDALGYRDPDYNNDPGSIRSYRLRQSRAWRTCTAIAVLAYIAACFLGKPPFAAHAAGLPTPTVLQGSVGQTWGLCLECGCLLFFTCDIYVLMRYTGFRSLLTRWWQLAFFLSLFLSLVDILTRGFTHRPWSRLFRPAAFFFVGPKVRDCSLSTLHAVGALLPVLLLELLVTLAYSCVCVVLYHGVSEAPFTTLSEAFLSLFALSTTVNDPDVWMSLYHRNRANVLVFSSFLVVQVFLLHNILLASVWNEFVERMKIYSRRKKKWREESVRRAFEALDSEASGYLSTETVMTLLMKIRPHYDGSKRYMMFERIVHSVSRSRSGKHYETSEVTKVNRRDFCDNIVEALSLKIRTMREQKIARRGQYMLLPLYVWNMAFVLVTCAMSPWVFNTRIFWAVLLPTSFLLGVSVLAEILMTGVRAYLVLPWNRAKTLSLVLTVTGLSWFFIFTATSQWEQIFQAAEWGEIRSVHIQVSIGLLMSARCLDFGTLLRLVPSINSVVSIMYSITPSVFAQVGVIFTIFHVYAYLGMALYGGVITQDADYGDTPFANLPYYYDNNFNSYPESLVTLFEFLVMNNWNMIITGYIHASPLTMWAYVYFLSFITLAVALALNVLTAIFMTAFTATSNKANMSVVRGAGYSSRSMTSGVARTALGAGASLALRPSMGQYLSSVSEQGSGDYSPTEGRSIRGNNTESVVDCDLEIKDDQQPDRRGWGRKRFASYPSPSTPQSNQQQQKQPKHQRQRSDLTFIPALLRASSGGKGGGGGGSSVPTPVHYPDPLRPSRLSASAVLPEDETIDEVGVLRRDDSYLGWGADGGGDGAPDPPPPGGGTPGRRRWGSGHYYKVSRRNSYSDKDMFEGNMGGEEDEEDVAGKVLGAVAIGLGNTVGIRACMLREGETRLRMHGKSSSPRQRSDTHSSGEDEPMDHLESQVMFESRAFRRMVAPHLPVQRAGLAPFDARDDEGWEAMAMREELTDMMLNSAFGEAIAIEFPPTAESPGLSSSRSGFPSTPASTKNISEDVSPSELEQASKVSSSGEDDIEEDYELPKDLGIRTWSKALTKEERAMRTGYKSKTAVLSIQCVLAIRKPAAVVVYTAKVLQ